MRALAITTLAVTVFLAGCGGGSTGAGSTSLPPGGAPAPVPTSSSVGVSVSFAAQPQTTSVQLSPIGGYTIGVEFPPVSGSGTITVTANTSAPQGAALSQIADYTGNPQNPTIGNASPLIYISFASNSSISVHGSPGFMVSLPSDVETNGRGFYFPRQQQQSWNLLNGGAAVNASGVAIKLNLNGPGFALGPGASQSFALAYCDIARIQLQLAKPLAAGTPLNDTLKIYANDSLNYPVTGPLSHPLTFSISDKNAGTSLQTTSVTSIDTPVQIAYNGKLDQFSITSTYESVTDTQPFTSTLPNGQPLSQPSGTTYPPKMQQFVLGSDGNFWTPFAYGVARVSPAGQFTYFADPNYQHQGPSSAIAEGSDGNVWIFYTVTGGGGIDRVTPNGQFTSFPFTSAVSGGFRPLVPGPDGALYFPGGTGVARIDMSGAMQNVANTPALSYLLLGPDNNLWGSGAGGTVYKITLTGQVATYTPVSGTDALDFLVGPDGNFWAPYAHLSPTLVKFNMQGALVSQSPLAYAPAFLDPAPSPNPTAPQRLGDMVKDSTGNIYLTDPHIGGVIRISPSGSYSEYPAPLIGQDQPIDLLFVSGKLYVSFLVMPPSGSGMEQGAIAPVDPSLW